MYILLVKLELGCQGRENVYYIIRESVVVPLSGSSTIISISNICLTELPIANRPILIDNMITK
jgi:hypothetical protein